MKDEFNFFDDQYLQNIKSKMCPVMLGIDLILDPFSDKLAADILLLNESDLVFLKKTNFIKSTCKLSNFDSNFATCLSYWDIIDATLTMSLASIGCDPRYISDLCLDVCDSLAFIQESDFLGRGIEFGTIYSTIQSEIEIIEIKNLKLNSEVDIHTLCTKLSIDVLNTHARCVTHLEGL